MNIRLVTIIIFVLIILGGLSIFFMSERNTRELTERISPTGQQSHNETTATSVRSRDGRVNFTYPTKWILTDTTSTTSGEFGPIIQSWTITNVSGDPTENVAKIIIETQKGGSNLAIDQLVDCSMKTITCDKVGIDNEQFIRAESVLNTGMRTTTVATFYDDSILRATGTVTPGSDQAALATSVNEVLNSFTFSTPAAN